MERTAETEPRTAGVPAGEARVLFVAIHGRHGAPEAMMEHLIRHLTAPDVHVLLPRAAGNSWYDARGFDPLTRRTRDQIRASIDQIAGDIEAAQAAGAPRDRVVIGGFSQGACMTLEYLHARGAWPGAACCLTGFRVGAVGDRRPIASLPDMPVYLSNGARDPFITLFEFAETVRELSASGARVRCDLFPREAHVMSAPEIATVDSVLRAVAEDRPLFEGSAT
jgi:phospholipase/carboxylesterase